ncbi:unnamed protein product [Rhizophagus irregularis]|nr:unnamed protein product [Rhizophagus irregularis]
MSTEDFAKLEGYGAHNEQTKAIILKVAGWEPDGTDNEIAKFLNTDITNGGLIRGIVMCCLDKQKTIMEQEHNEAVAFQQEIINILTEKVNFLQDKIEQMHIFVAEKDKYIIEKDRRHAELEQQYYANANPRHTLSYQEKPYYEHEDASKFNKHNNKEWNHIRPRHHVTSEPSTPKNINANSGWENLHNSSNMDLDRKSEINENYDQIDNKLNAKAKKPYINNMVEQEIELEIRDKETDRNGVNESIHSPTSNKEIKYYAGKIRALINMDDQEIVNQINNRKYLAYHLTKCGLSINKGNQYLTIGFFTENDRDSFINNDAIAQIFGGKFQPMNHLDKIERHVNIRIEGLEDTVTMDDLSQILRDLEIGEITSVQQRNYNNKNEWSCNLMIKTTKSIKELENLWSIQSLKQSLKRYKFVSLDDRYIKWNKKQLVYLQLKGIQQDQVNPTELADEIAKRNAVYWKKEEGDKGSWVITVAFKNNEARESVKEDQITINGTKLAWHHLIKDNTYNQEQRTGGFCKICRTKSHDTTQCRYYIADYIPKSQRRFNNRQKDNRSNGQQPFRGYHQQGKHKEREHQSHTRQYNDNEYGYQQTQTQHYRQQYYREGQRSRQHDNGRQYFNGYNSRPNNQNEHRRRWNYETQRHNGYSNDQCQDNEYRYN